MSQYRILLFGIARDIVGNSTLEVEFEGELTSGRLLERIGELYPEMQGLKKLMLAVNEEYSGADQAIAPGDDLALIPPVSGG